MSFWSILGKIGAGVAAPFTGGASLGAIPLIDAAGKAFGAGSQASASNRGSTFEAMLMAQAARENSERDTLSKLAQTAYLKGGGADFKPSTPYSYSFAPKPASAAQMAGASTLEQELLKRLLNPPDYNKQLKPGTWEKLSGLLGAGLSGYSTAAQLMNRGGEK